MSTTTNPCFSVWMITLECRSIWILAVRISWCRTPPMLFIHRRSVSGDGIFQWKLVYIFGGYCTTLSTRNFNAFSFLEKFDNSPNFVTSHLSSVSSHPTNGSTALSNKNRPQIKAFHNQMKGRTFKRKSPLICIVLFVENSVTKLRADFSILSALSCTNTRKMIVNFPCLWKTVTTQLFCQRLSRFHSTVSSQSILQKLLNRGVHFSITACPFVTST